MTLRLGVAGLGRGFISMLPTFVAETRVRLTACADPRPEARERFAGQFDARGHKTVAALCADPGIDAVYVATPHGLHRAHAEMAAAAGKHVLVEKPMAVTLHDAAAMVAAAQAAGVAMVVGHSHAFDAPIRHARALIASGDYGAFRSLTMLTATDFMYRPRRPEELDTAQGGGVAFNQASHQVDIARLLGGGLVRSVRATAGVWDAGRPTEGAYSAMLHFAGGAVATLTYTGYARFDTDEFTGWIAEAGTPKDPAAYGAARRALAAAPDEAAARQARTYGGAQFQDPPAPSHHQQFGFVLAQCDHADLRPMPHGVMIYGATERRLDALPPPRVPRAAVIDDLLAAVAGQKIVHDGAGGMATLEVCAAILRSSREGREILLDHQVSVA